MSDLPPFLTNAPSRIADAHVHFYDDANADAVVESASRFGVTRLFVSCLGSPPLNYSPTLDLCRAANRVISRAVRRYPDRVIGYCYVNPCYEAEALSEFRTCIEQLGLRGLKLWMSCYCDDPRVYPLIEQAVAYNTPVLIHTWSIVGGSKPNESEARHVARLASRYPEVTIIMAHISGDWQLALPIVQPYPNVHVDTSGTDPEIGQFEAAVRMLGPERVLYGSDIPIRDLGSQIAKILGAEIDTDARSLLLWGNLERLVGRMSP